MPQNARPGKLVLVSIMSTQSAVTERDAYSVEEIAARLPVTTRHVYRMVERGELPSIRLGHRILIRISDYERWLREGAA
jgi:excisionase family DNA binding protein